MISHWLHCSDQNELIVFFNGWGMDHHPIELLTTNSYDVLVFSNYTGFHLPEDFAQTISRYEKTYLICWSFGVWAAQQLFFDKKKQFAGCIAINGTLKPINDDFGIPVTFFHATLKNYSKSVQERFYRRMCRQSNVYDLFMSLQPQRPIDDQRKELQSLADMIQQNNGADSIFDEVIISSDDRIIPTMNQQAFWKEQGDISIIDGCHFPFTNWQRWDDIVDLVRFDG